MDPETGKVKPELKIVDQHRYHAMDATRYLCGGYVTDYHGVVALAQGRRDGPGFFNDLHGRKHPASQVGLRIAKSKNTWDGGEEQMVRPVNGPIRSGAITHGQNGWMPADYKRLHNLGLL